MTEEENSQKEKPKTEKDSAEMTIGDYIIKKTIGSGTFSTVKLGVHRITHKKVAIKILDKSKIESRDDLERIIREMQILIEMHNPFVIKVYKIYEDKNNFSIIMEYCEGGELFNYIVKKKRLSEEESSYFFYQLINGIEYIHSKGIAHRDLKPENLLLSKNKILKIIDFGLSNFYDGQKRLQTPCGSPCYASPEMVKGKKYDGFNIDIWAIGVILFAMLCGYLPFEDDENDTDVLFNEIIKNKIDYPYFLSRLSLDILQKILVSDPLKRITIEEIKRHEFYLRGEEIFKSIFEERSEEEDIKHKEKEKEKKQEILKEKEKEKNKEIIKDKDKSKEKEIAGEEIKQEKKEIKSEQNLSLKKDKKEPQTYNTKKINNLMINKIFTKIEKNDRNERNNSRPKGPITIILKKEEDNSIPYKHINNEIKSRNNTNTNKENNLANNKINIISSYNNNDITNKYSKTNNDINTNKINFLMKQNNNMTGKNGIMKIFGLKNKKKLFTKLKLKNHKFIRYDIKNIINTEGKPNKINLKYNINFDSIKNAKNSLDKPNNIIKSELTSFKKNGLNDANIDTLKLIDNKSNSKNKRNEVSLKKKLMKYNIMGLKHYNNMVNNINININNISRSAQKDKQEPSFTNNNIINLNVILNNTSHNNNKNLDSLQIINDNDNKKKKFSPVTPSQMRFIPSKKSTLPSITISDRIKPKINTYRFKSINANKYYLNTESNYERVERQKKIFLDNVFKKHEKLKLNTQKNQTNIRTYNE